MKLYTSSLLGGGTNVKVAFAKDMTAAEKDFEKAQKKRTQGSITVLNIYFILNITLTYLKIH